MSGICKRNAVVNSSARTYQIFRARTLVLKSARLLIALAFASNLLGIQAQAQGSSEYAVKAAFLYNFAKFVEWPPGVFGNDGAPLVVGVVGDDPFGSALDQTIRGKSANGRQLIIRRFSWGQNLRECHILFISSSERKRLSQILDSLRGAGVLTVGETDHFNQQGGIINFVIEKGKVRFEINAGAAESSHLKLSSKLLALAKSVR